jgi:hypothetical protein
MHCPIIISIVNGNPGGNIEQAICCTKLFIAFMHQLLTNR